MEEILCKDCNLKSSATKVLNAAELERLGSNCVGVNFRKGDVIFKQGAFSSNIIYVRSGLVKIHMAGPVEEQIIKITKAPSYLGIPTTFGEKINQYSATAIDNTTVCFIDIEVFKEFIFLNGRFAYEIVVELCRNELNSFQKCVDRTQKHIHGRAADALLFFSNGVYGNDEFTLPLSRLELGHFVNTSRESICRILSDFGKAGIISLSGKKIKILNRDLLETISKNG